MHQENAENVENASIVSRSRRCEIRGRGTSVQEELLFISSAFVAHVAVIRTNDEKAIAYFRAQYGSAASIYTLDLSPATGNVNGSGNGKGSGPETRKQGPGTRDPGPRLKTASQPKL